MRIWFKFRRNNCSFHTFCMLQGILKFYSNLVFLGRHERFCLTWFCWKGWMTMHSTDSTCMHRFINCHFSEIFGLVFNTTCNFKDKPIMCYFSCNFGQNYTPYLSSFYTSIWMQLTNSCPYGVFMECFNWSPSGCPDPWGIQREEPEAAEVMGVQTAVVLGPAVLDSLYSRLWVVHPRADDRKINIGFTILAISSVVSTLSSASVFEFRLIEDWW